MGLRFRRSIKLAPGIRLNFSGSGTGLTLGPRGASVSFGSRGTYLNTGIPGTGLSSRSRLDEAPSTPTGTRNTVHVRATIRVDDDGTVSYLDANGNPLNEYLTRLSKRQQGARIREMLSDACDNINAEMEGLGAVYQCTPDPTSHPSYTRPAFETPQPTPPALKSVGFFARLFGRRETNVAENARRTQEHHTAVATWQKAKDGFERGQDAAEQAFNTRLRADVDFMQQQLEDNLSAIIWPRETLVSFEIRDAGAAVVMDVDLPEIEDLPRKVARLPERGYKLSVKELKGKPLHDHYSRHVFGVGFRIIGEAFATLPGVNRVTLEAYTQRLAPATGQTTDTYIYSVRADRKAWSRINFGDLGSVDAFAALATCELRVKVNRNGMLEPIVPHDA